MRKPRKIKQKKQKKAEIIVLESSYKIDKKNIKGDVLIKPFKK